MAKSDLAAARAVCDAAVERIPAGRAACDAAVERIP